MHARLHLFCIAVLCGFFVGPAFCNWAPTILGVQTPPAHSSIRDGKVAAYAAASNDDFAERTVLTGNYIGITNSLLAAQRERAEPRHGAHALGRSLWWTWTAPADGEAYVVLQGSDFDPIIAVYNGSSLRKLRRVARSERTVNAATRHAVANFTAQAGRTYEIAIDCAAIQGAPPAEGTFVLGLSFSTLKLVQPANNSAVEHAGGFTAQITAPNAVDGEIQRVQYILADALGYTRIAGESTTPPFAMTITNETGGMFALGALAIASDGAELIAPPVRFTLRPLNDAITNATAVPGYHTYTSSSTAGASREVKEPPHGGSPARASVWFAWTAPASGPASARLYFEAPGFRFDIYSGADTQTLHRVATRQGRSSGIRSRDFDAIVGTTYFVAVDRAGSIGSVEGKTEFTLEMEMVTFRLVSPSNGQSYNASTPLPLRIETTEPVDDIDRVEYLAGHPFIGQTLVATATNAPFDIDWPTHSGEYHVSARLIKKDGTLLPSKTARITIRPANDNFADRVFLTGTNVDVMTDNASATSEEGEPPINSQVLGEGSIWFSWTAPTNGLVLIDTLYAPFFQPIHVFRGETLTTLQQITNLIFNPFNQLRFVATNGETLSIAVLGGGQLRMKFYAAPSNDSFESPVTLVGINSETSGNNMFATTDPGEPLVDAGRGRTVWFSWTAPQRGIALLRGTNAPLLLGTVLSAAVYTGSTLPQLTPVASGPLGPLAFNVVSGITYHIALDDRSFGVEAYRLQLDLMPAPTNDDFADATSLQGVEAEFNYISSGASRESGEPGHGDLSCWWNWTAPATGPVTFEGRLAPLRVSVYTGAELPSLTPLASTDYKLYLQATQGVTYRIAFSTYFGNFGVHTVRLLQADNDHFTNARAILGDSMVLRGTLYGTTGETGEPGHNPPGYPRNSVWWQWTSPANATVHLRDLTESYRPPRLAAYTGNSVSSLTLVPEQQFVDAKDGGLNFAASAGITYYISIWGVEDYHLQFATASAMIRGSTDVAGDTMHSVRGNGFIDIELPAITGSIVLESSSDLKSWDAVDDNWIVQANKVRITTTNFSHRFFRARRPAASTAKSQ